MVKDLPADFRDAVEGNKSPKAPTHQQPLFSLVLKEISPEVSFRLFSRIIPLSLGKFLTSYLVQLEPPLVVIKWVPSILVGNPPDLSLYKLREVYIIEVYIEG